MERIRVGDIEMAYNLMGDGAPLVMIMGLFANSDWWEPELLDSLSKHFRLLVFDNRGSGRSEAGREAFTIKLFAGDVAGLMETLGIDRAHVFGVSMGGMIAQQFALDYPGKVDSLALGCTMCSWTHAHLHLLEIADHLAGDPIREEAYLRRVAELAFPAKWIAANPERFASIEERAKIKPIHPVEAAKQLLAVLHFSSCDDLHRVQAPTRITCGSADILIPPENSAMIAGNIPGSQLRVFEGGGHGYFIQYRDEVASDLIDFLG